MFVIYSRPQLRTDWYSWLNSLPIDELGNWFLKSWMGMLTLHLCLTSFTGGTAIGGHISPIYESEVSVRYKLSNRICLIVTSF